MALLSNVVFTLLIHYYVEMIRDFEVYTETIITLTVSWCKTNVFVPDQETRSLTWYKILLGLKYIKYIINNKPRYYFIFLFFCRKVLTVA